MKLSFVLPTFNNAAFLHPAVDSCLQQTHKDIEVIIVDDGSKDSTHHYLNWLENQGHGDKVKIIRHGVNLGRSAARNAGNRLASGEAILVLDADDIAHPKRAELTAKKLEEGAEFVHGAAHKMDAVRRDLGLMETDVFDKEKALATLTNRIVHSTVAYSKAFAEKYPYPVGDAERLGLDDWACFIAAALDGVKFEYIPTPLCAYRQDVGVTAERDEAEVKKFKEAFLNSLKVAA